MGPERREIYFLAPDGTMNVVAVQTRPQFRAEIPQPLFHLRRSAWWKDFDVSADTSRFIALVQESSADSRPLSVITGWHTPD